MYDYAFSSLREDYIESAKMPNPKTEKATKILTFMDRLFNLDSGTLIRVNCHIISTDTGIRKAMCYKNFDICRFCTL